MNCIIVHGCPSDEEKAMNPETRTYDKHWLKWLQRQLIAAGIPTENPMMPKPWAPDYDAYKKVFEQCHIDEHTVLVGHSCGSAFLVRWLGDTKQSIAKLILVAPWKIPDPEDALLVVIYTYDIDETIKDRVKKIVIFTSDNEEESGKKSAELFHNALGGEVISLLNHGHYCFGDMGTEEFPELLEVILR